MQKILMEPQAILKIAFKTIEKHKTPAAHRGNAWDIEAIIMTRSIIQLLPPFPSLSAGVVELLSDQCPDFASSTGIVHLLTYTY